MSLFEDTPTVILLDYAGSRIRVVMRDEPWFVIIDVGAALDQADPTKMIQHVNVLNRDVAKLPAMDSRGHIQRRSYAIAPMSVVRRTVARSNMPGAPMFLAWLDAEADQTLRWGQQSWPRLAAKPAEPPLDDVEIARLIADPHALLAILKGVTEQNVTLREDNAKLTVRNERLAASEGTVCVQIAAQTLGVNPDKINDLMDSHGWIYKDVRDGRWLPYSRAIHDGYLRCGAQSVWSAADDGYVVERQTLVTPMGLAKLREKLADERPSGAGLLTIAWSN